jgi:tryptophanyl-tRNA synthetase
VTDSIPEIYYDAENRPGVSNLLRIYAALAPGESTSPDDPELTQQFAGLGMGQLKAAVTDTVNGHLVREIRFHSHQSLF